jgi:hypothetical protein
MAIEEKRKKFRRTCYRLLGVPHSILYTISTKRHTDYPCLIESQLIQPILEIRLTLQRKFETNTYSEKWNCLVSFPISEFLYIRAIYIFLWLVCLCCCIVFADRLWEGINHSQIHECRNWERGRSSFISANICFKLSTQCICCVGFLSLGHSVRLVLCL